MGDEGRRRVERYDPDRHGLPEFGYQEQPHAFYNGTHSEYRRYHMYTYNDIIMCVYMILLSTSDHAGPRVPLTLPS